MMIFVAGSAYQKNVYEERINWMMIEKLLYVLWPNLYMKYERVVTDDSAK